MFDLDEVRSCTRAYFDAVGDRYLELFRDELEQKPYDQAILVQFAKELGMGARVCDAGCGPCGHVARILADHGLEVVGVDISERCIELAKAAQPDLDFRALDMLDSGFPTGSLDGIVVYYAIPYIPKAHLPELFAEFRRVLRPKGSLLLVTKEGEEEGFIEDPMGTDQRTFFASFTQGELGELLDRCGFEGRFAETREPYEFEFPVRRIYFIAEKRTP